MKQKKFNFFGLFLIGFSFLLLFFTLYSYTQIDLNLTLWTNASYQRIQQFLIWVGYFNRPLSSFLYLVLFFLLFGVYALISAKSRIGKISFPQLRIIIVLVCIVLFFSYPAFSHDMFNYMFDARIVTKYFSNPYQFSALQFPDDLWIRFMHWTHRTYPYGPFWLLVTIPFSFLGFGKFVLTLGLFKILFLFSYIGNCYFIFQILKKVNPKHAVFGLTLFSLNPLIITETLISPHNESIMLFFLLFATYLFFVSKRSISGFGMLIVSAGIKFITIVCFIPFLYSLFVRKKMSFDRFIGLISFSLMGAIMYEFYIREPYPWYFVMLIGVLSLVPTTFISIAIYVLSASALLRYLPYLYVGDYSQGTLEIENLLFWVPIGIFFFSYLAKKGYNSFRRRY